MKFYTINAFVISLLYTTLGSTKSYVHLFLLFFLYQLTIPYYLQYTRRINIFFDYHIK